MRQTFLVGLVTALCATARAQPGPFVLPGAAPAASPAEAAFAEALTAADLAGSGALAPDLARQLERTGLACRPPRGWLRVSAEIPGTRVTVAAGSFLAPRTLGALGGRHVLQLEAPGYAPREVAVTVEAGRGQALAVVLERLVPGPTLAGTETGHLFSHVHARPPPPRDDTAAWLMTAGAAVALAGGFAFHMWAVDAALDVRALKNAGAGDRDAAAAAFQQRMVATGVLYAVGAAATLVAVALWLVPESPALATALTPTLGASADGGLLGVQGRF